MRPKTSASLVVAAFALMALSAGEAVAQPTVTWQQIGNQLRIDWTAVPGATEYDVIVTGALNGQATIATNFVQVPAPGGTYVVQVRGRAGSTVGPLSAPVTIVIGGAGPGPCAPVEAPTITVSTSGNLLTVTWGAIAGAAGYRIQVGASPGATQVSQDLPANQTAFSVAVPIIGTFYIRVLAGSACGALASSAEQSFTIGSPTPGPGPTPGTGPRTADPPPGSVIPRASLSYALGIIESVARQYNSDLQNSCREHGGNNIFMFRVVQALRRVDTRWGMNDKRGNLGDMSQDVITYNPTNRPDPNESQIYLYDVISNHCGNGRADVWMNDVTDVTWDIGLRGDPACGTRYCARWTIDQYLRAGFPANP
jgi:hypothetical protein